MFRDVAHVVVVALLLLAPGRSRTLRLMKNPMQQTNSSKEKRHQEKRHHRPINAAWQLSPDSTQCFRPHWEYYFENVYDLYFIHVGAGCGTNACMSCGESLWNYQDRFHWSGAVVEPNPVSYRDLDANYVDHPRIRPLWLAISDVDNRTIDFWCNDDSIRCTTNAHWATVANFMAFTSHMKVPARTLSGLWKDLRPTKVDLLVIDVEDAEYRILELPLPKPKPHMIFFETMSFMDKKMDPKGDMRLEMIRQQIRDQGYKPLFLGKDESHRDDLWELTGIRNTTSEVVWKA